MNDIKVLLVEDDRFYRFYASQALKQYQLETAKSVGEAKIKVETIKPDIIFLDIALPDGNGLELLKEVKGNNPDAHVIMITGSSSEEDAKAALDNGAAGYIVKPFNVARIQAYVNNYIKSKDPRSDEENTDEEKSESEG